MNYSQKLGLFLNALVQFFIRKFAKTNLMYLSSFITDFDAPNFIVVYLEK